MNDLTYYEIEPVRQDGEFAFARVARPNAFPSCLLVSPLMERPAPSSLAKLENAFALRDELDSSWAARPMELVHYRGRLALVVEDPDGEFLDEKTDGTLGVPDFLRMAIGIASSIAHMHARGLVHKDVKPANVIANARTGEAWITGFSLATRLPRHRQSAEAPEIVAGTLPYMAPEQTGWMNRSIDSRSDLYSLGVTFYEMLVGLLPFNASDPMEWVHCHIARLPMAPNLRRPEIPECLSAIILKLLAKAPEERYQTAAGVEADLRRCLSSLEARGKIESFTLGAGDVPDRLMVSEKLYGREKEIKVLLSAFDRVVSKGTPELVLVSGFSGVGKSSVVNELHKALMAPRGLFASGKFDQFKRDIPYATLAQAFQRLIRPILAKSEAELGRWRETLLDALEPHGDLIVDLVPELKLIVGEQEPVPELPAPDAQRRFQLVLRRFIGVFARPEHPLTLFLDDLQWLDAATLDLLEDLFTQESVSHLLLIGAYRDNEVDASHPLMRKLGLIKAVGTSHVEEILLGALDAQHVSQMLADALYCKTELVGDLAQLILQKTDGNPFFINQFLSTLTDEGLIAFDPAHSRWSWDLKRIHAKGYTDNVADLMIAKLVRLPAATREALQQLACLGNIATTAMLAIVHDTTEQELHASLLEARRQELVDFLESSYRFAHDRVHEAAYALIPAERRAAVHLRIGRMLVADTPRSELDEAIFEIVNQLNRASSLVTAPEEREQLAGFNLLAGKRAQASSAYVSALNYLTTGAALLTEDTWRQGCGLGFALELTRAHCELASGATAEAEERLRNLDIRAVTTGERVAVACLQVDLYQGIDCSNAAVAVGLRALRHLGVDIPEHPTEADARRAYDGIWTRLGDREIEDLINLPLVSDPDSLSALDLLIRVAVPGFFDSYHLGVLIVCTAVSLGLERGHSDASCIAYAQLGTMAGPHFGQFDAGYRFGRLGCQLVERPELQRFKARTFETFGFVVPWTQHIRKGREFLFRGFDLASRIGEISYAGYACGQLNTNYLMAGDPLIEAQEQAEHGLAFARKVGFGIIEGWILGQLGLIRSLRGLTVRLGSFDDTGFRESELELDLAGNPALALPACWYYIRKLQARFLAGEYAEALMAASRAQPMLWGTTVTLLEVVEYYFYDALCLAAVHESASSEDRISHCAMLAGHLEKLETWALHCPENFANRAALVGAEVARIEGRDVDAMRLYEQAIRSAREHGFVQNEGVAYEVAARFYAARGFETFADAYLRNARYCYLRWGADGKVRQLDRLYPHLGAAEGQRPASLDATIGTPVGQLDAETVARASQALSSEIVLPRLIERLMRIAVEYAGAERGLLVLLRGSKPLIEAEATTGRGRVDVHVRQTDITASDLPLSALQYVVRTQERIVLDDASIRSPYSDDEYLRQKNAKSLLCLPIVKQTKMIGVLYLENNLASHVFTSSRVAVLDMLASQAAISLENARLYAALEEENLERKRAEEELRRSEAYLAEAQRLSCTGSFGWCVPTDEHFWSDETYRIFEYEVSSKVSMKMVRDRIHPEDFPLLDNIITHAASGDRFDFEYRLLLPTGAVKHVHVVAHPILRESGTHEFVGAVMDITATRRAEAALRQAQAELAHVTRVTTMGELAASIAHEVNQPISGVVLNGNACLRWLSGVKEDSTNLNEAREAIQRIVRDGSRAGEIIARIRALFKKADPTKEPLNINQTVREVIVLARGQMDRQQVMLQLELAPDLPEVAGDRVQLQQLMLNLILNAIDAMATVHGRARDLIIRTQYSGEPNEVMVMVRDSGIGIDPTTREQIFAAFHTTKPSGLGMGLSISRSIVENHSGRLWATAHEGPGASFHFTLPIVSLTGS